MQEMDIFISTLRVIMFHSCHNLKVICLRNKLIIETKEHYIMCILKILQPIIKCYLYFPLMKLILVIS